MGCKAAGLVFSEPEPKTSHRPLGSLVQLMGASFWPHLADLPLSGTNQPVALCTQEHLLCCSRPGWCIIRFEQLYWAVVTESSAPRQRHVNGRVVSLDWSNAVSSSEPSQVAQLFWLSSRGHLSPAASFATSEGIHLPRMSFWNEPQKFHT